MDDKIFAEAFKEELEKIAKISDRERTLVEYFTGQTLGFMPGFKKKENLEKAQKIIEEEAMKSFALRHPFLSGFVTLGTQPQKARMATAARIAERLYKEFPKIRKIVKNRKIVSGMTQHQVG